MPIDVNGYSAQFNQFVQFAEQAGKSTAKAQVGGAAEGSALAGRTIVAKTRSDSIGNVGRLADSREINDVVICVKRSRTTLESALKDDVFSIDV